MLFDEELLRPCVLMQDVGPLDKNLASHVSSRQRCGP